MRRKGKEQGEKKRKRKEEETERFLLAKVYSQDPSFLEWCTEIAGYLCQKWRTDDIQLQEQTQLQEPMKASKCTDVQEPILTGYPTGL